VTNLFINTIISWDTDDPEPFVERILAINQDGTQVVVIRLFIDKGLPRLREAEEIKSAIANSRARILEADSHAKLKRPDTCFTRAQLNNRDKNWKLISQLPLDDIEFMVSQWKRGPLVATLEKRSGRHRNKILAYIRGYYQAGKVINGLIPDYSLCGAPGKRRVVAKQDGKRLGRRSELEKSSGQVLAIKITPDIERRFERGVKKFYENGKSHNLKNTFDRMTDTYFNKGFEIINGVLTPILPPASERPKFRQFQYWYRTHYRDIKREKQGREGEKFCNTNFRELIGDASARAYGPGSLYEIDSTISDVYLVSALDRSCIIGRPVTYFCMDVFSRAIVGLAVTLEGPSWLSAMLALENTLMNKVEFCSEFGIEIEESEWPCCGLPAKILADRGEMEGAMAEGMIKPMQIALQNTAPYRADWKGGVEQNFRRSKEKSVKFMPGVVYHRRPGDPDYRLDATLTLHEFTRAMIFYALHYNNHHYLKYYRMDKYMIPNHIERYPLDLWDYGVDKRNGCLRPHDSREMVQLNLLPTKKVKVTEFGIHFGHQLYYTCETAMRKQWLLRAKESKAWEVEVSYHPRRVDTIYLHINDGLEPCHLTGRSQAYKDSDWYSAEKYFNLQVQEDEASMSRRQQAKTYYHARLDNELKQGAAKTKAAQEAAGHQSKRSKLTGIRDNREREKVLERQKADGKGAAPTKSNNLASVTSIDNRSGDNKHEGYEYIPPDQGLDLLDTLLEEKLQDD